MTRYLAYAILWAVLLCAGGPGRTLPTAAAAASSDGSDGSGGARNCTALMPGCLSCALATTSTTTSARRMMLGTPDLDSSASALNSQFGGAYAQPAGFRCGACDRAAGYTLNDRYGRCGAPLNSFFFACGGVCAGPRRGTPNKQQPRRPSL